MKALFAVTLKKKDGSWTTLNCLALDKYEAMKKAEATLPESECMGFQTLGKVDVE